MDELHRVRRDAQIERMRQVRDLEPFGDAADTTDVGLNDIGATLCDELLEAIFGVLVLTRGDRNINCARYGCQARDIIGEDRFLKPTHAIVRQVSGDADRLLRVVTIVRVNKDLNVVADRLADRRDAADVFRFRSSEVLGYLHLYSQNAAIHVARLLADELYFRERGPASRAIDGDAVGKG